MKDNAPPTLYWVEPTNQKLFKDYILHPNDLEGIIKMQSSFPLFYVYINRIHGKCQFGKKK